jgi:hypothetical protein
MQELCELRNNAHSAARAKTTQYAAKRSTQRLVKDFRSFHPSSVTKTHLKRLRQPIELEHFEK